VLGEQHTSTDTRKAAFALHPPRVRFRKLLQRPDARKLQWERCAMAPSLKSQKQIS
jgi:hypothetical protein